MLRLGATLLTVSLSGAVGGGMAGRAEAQSVAELFGKVAPAVVVVQAKAAGGGRIGGIGSGVVVSKDGKIMTAAHLVHGADRIEVQFLGGRTVNARVLASELSADLSLVQLDQLPAALEPAALANSDAVRVGEQVIVVGAPYGLAHALSVGWISARWAPGTVYKAIPLAEFFQTDASINVGNSGGPMFNMAGEVIGIVSHVISKSGGSEGLGFVVTMNTAKQLLLERRSIWSGLEGQLLSDDLADLFNLPPKTGGLLVKTVAQGSPGEATGINGGRKTATIDGQPLVVGGDIILDVLGIAVTTAADLARIRERTSRLARGAPVTLTVLRAGRQMKLTGKAVTASYAVVPTAFSSRCRGDVRHTAVGSAIRSWRGGTRIARCDLGGTTMKTCRRWLGLGTVTAWGLLALSPATAQTPAPAPTTPMSSDMAAQHTMEGEVTKVDAKKGWIDIKSPEGRMKLHFPPSALQSVKVGDRVSVDMGLKR